MKKRRVILPNGKAMLVPQCIQRIDTGNTHGWQVRYAGTKLFSDFKGTHRDSLRLASAELQQRIAAQPAPTKLKRGPSRHKTSTLPPGISGPLLRRRSGERQAYAVLAVHVPIFGRTAKLRTLYIGTEQTYTQARFESALQRALVLRASAEDAYRDAATRARRSTVRTQAAA